VELNAQTKELINMIENEPLATIIVESDNNAVAQALGKVIGQAVQTVGFSNVSVKHNANLDDNNAAEPQSDWEQGKSMLDAIADANPALFSGKIEVVSICLGEPEEDESDLPPNEAADMADAMEHDRDD
jgi:hypothetical protein